MRRPSIGLERAWSGLPGTAAWTRVLLPLAWAYGAAAAGARRRSARTRARVEGAIVLAFGGLTTGGSGKSSVVRWFARRLADTGSRRVAVLLRGHGASRPGAFPMLVPDYAGVDLSARLARYGDDALAHRKALPRSVAVITGSDRLAAARAAVDGFGAEILLLDDGWEQRGVQWDQLVAVLDPLRPTGNGLLLPAGPLRRPPETLAEAAAVAFVLEEDSELSRDTRAFVERHAPAARLLLYRRRLVGLAPPGEVAAEAVPGSLRAGLISGVGAPERLARFVRAQGLTVVGHAAFSNHATWTRRDLERAAAQLARARADVLLITGKDEARWPRALGLELPVRVLRTDLDAMGPESDPARLLAAARGGPPLAGRGAFG